VTTAQDRFFSAEGKAKIAVTPDQAVINLGVTSTQTTVNAAQETVNQTMNGLTQALSDLGIDKKHLQSTNYSVYPNYNWEVTPQRIVGYTINSSLEVTITDFAQINTVIDLATAQGVNQVSNLNFTVSDEKRKQLKAQAREIAIAEAAANAKELARLTNITLGEIVNVWESELGTETSLVYNRALKAESAMSMSDAAATIEAGETDFNYQVTLEYRTL
jgi:uncharacterized protein YggE